MTFNLSSVNDFYSKQDNTKRAGSAITSESRKRVRLSVILVETSSLVSVEHQSTQGYAHYDFSDEIIN